MELFERKPDHPEVAFLDRAIVVAIERLAQHAVGRVLHVSEFFRAFPGRRKHYWKRDEREQYVAHRDNLLDLVSRARQAETPEELAEMQRAADGVLREALDCYEDGAIEEGDLSVIGLALEQFHHAVRRPPRHDRRR